MRRKGAALVPKAADPNGLVATWRREAVLARELGAVEAAQTLERCAGQLEVVEREHVLELLTLEQASAVSGYSYSALQRLVSTGKLKNAGTPHRPRIRRADLPRRPGVETTVGLDLVDKVNAARRAHGG